MKKIIFEADVQIPRWERQRRQFEVNIETVNALLLELSPDDNPLMVSVHDLIDLLLGKGEITTKAKLAGKEGEIVKLLRALAVSAWKHNVPWEIEGAEFSHRGEEHFERFVRAYPSSDA